jgi:Family of unknown function (DUF6152)
MKTFNARIGARLVLGMLLLTAVPLVAHHGAASFDTEKELTLKGTVTEWIWANPHCFLKFDAMDDTGAVRNWAVETQNPTDMSKRGWRRNSFKVGDVVTVTLQAVKNGAPVGRVRTVVLPNGQTLGTTLPVPAAPPQG